MKYNKLVRDKVPEFILKKEGKMPLTHVASQSEYYTKLSEKLKEETDEFIASDSIEELVDILEVIDAIIIAKKVSKHTLNQIKKEKAKQRGTFTRRIILDEA